MSEDIDKLNASARELAEVMRNLTGQMGDLTGAAGANARTTANMSDAEKKAAEALAKLRVNTEGLSEVEKARIEAQKKLLEYDRQLAEAGAKAKDALKGFASGILETNVKLTNLNAGLSSAGDAAFALGKAFGPLGMVIGGLVKGFTMLMEANLKISQAYLEGKDQLSKMGGAGAHTTKSLQEMTREAGLNAETLGRMIKPMQSMGHSIMALGGTAGDSQKAFAKLVKATDEERARMSRLGIDQEAMMQGQAEYLQLQSMSGRALKNDVESREKLRKASLEYQVNLMELSALTGKDAQTLKDRQKDMLANRQVQMANLQLSIKAKNLREAADKETDAARKAELIKKAEAAEKEVEARNKSFEMLAGAPEVLRKGIQQLTTGTITGPQAQILRQLPGMGKAVDEFNRKVKEGTATKEDVAKLQDAYQRAQEKNIDAYGRLAAINDDVATRRGLMSQEDNETVGQNIAANKTYLEKLSQVQKGITEAGKAGKDGAADARAALQNANIKAAGAIEDVVSALNPFKLGLIGLTAAAGAAALALGVMAKRGMFSGPEGSTGILDKLKGAIGFGGGAGGGAAAAGAAGGAAAAVPGGAGAGQIAEGLGKGPSGGGPGFLEKAAKGLAAFANPKVVIGAGAFGVAIAAVGAGIAGATWIISKALPSLAEGLTPFEKLDGDKLKSAGAGIAAIGGGLAAFGAGGAIGALGGIVGGLGDKLGKAMGMDGPFKKLEDFSKLNIDAKKVKENAEAFMAFNKAMAMGGAAGAAGSAGGLFGGLMDKLSSKLNLKDPLIKLQEFASIKIDEKQAKQIETNAQAFVYFSQAMESYKGSGQGMWSTLTEKTAGFFELEPPVEKMKKFAAIDLGKGGPERVKTNAEAFVLFSNAMAGYKGTGQSALGALTEGAASFFEIDPPTEKMKKFASIDLGKGGAERVKTNAQAFVYFSQALSEYKGGGELKNAADNIVGGIVKMFGGDDVMDKFVKFTKLDVDPDRALKLGTAFANYMSAMGGGKAGGGAAAAPAARAASAGGGGGGAAPAAAGGGGGGAAPAAAGGGGGLLARAASFLGFGGAGVETDPDASADDGKDKPKEVTSKPKNVTISPSADISGVDSTLLTKFYSAAAEYGQPIRINSAFRGDQKQAELYVRGRMLGEPGIFMPARPKNDTSINYKGVNYSVPGSGKGSKHREGDALDITGDYGVLDPILAKYGLHRPHLPKDPPHVELKAEKGGVASGPKTGYPATLHGNEIIVPIDPQSLLVELGKKSKGDLQTEMASNPAAAMGGSAESLKELSAINQAMMDMMANKLDAVISRLEAGNDTQGKLLKYSQA